MAKYAKIKIENYRTDFKYEANNSSVPVLITRNFGDIVIEVVDENNNQVDNNYGNVNYQEYFNGVAGQKSSVAFGGPLHLLAQNKLLKEYNSQSLQTYDIIITGPVEENNGGYIPPGTSDLAIISVAVNKQESYPGAADGEIIINARSSYGPIQYSVDGVNYQDKATFSKLIGGGYTAYAKDGIANSIRSQTFNLPTISSLLTGDPSVAFANGNISRWSAAYNPVVFTYQRRDFAVTGIYADSYSGKVCFTIDQDLAGLKEGDTIYLQAGIKNGTYAYQGGYEVAAVGWQTVYIKTPYIKPEVIQGFVNIDALRPYYKVQTRITYQDTLTGQTKAITATHRPDGTGLVKADLSNFLQSLLRIQDASDYTQINYRDDNLSASYTIAYAETWEGHEPVYINSDTPYYVTYSAKQLGDEHGGNMAGYVPFKKYTSPSQRAKWITDFTEPAYSIGYPFDIGFIYSEHIAGLSVYYELTPLDINRSPLPDGIKTSYLLNEDSSFLLNQDGSRLIIARQAVVNKPITQPIAQHIGLNRLLINQRFSDQVCYFNIALKYDNSEGSHYLTQIQTIRIDNAVDEQSVYLRWIGLTGSWNYYRFVYNQEVTLDVQNAVIVKNYVRDWSAQQGIEEVVSKSAGQKMKVIAEDLSIADIKGLQSIKYSPKVQMLVNKNPVRWQTVVLNTATFAEYETRNGQAPFSITFNLPALNIQTQ
ncbi:hypothetical protein KHS38_09700 [Mucilaginibacter sp. Bleaf8]|uniref:hypothetical protein n=1 Tax=Mucilaginibacter sp. Bleaf8 TaxID=2834430 RepID=UPI001BCDCB02|nr:hypothetical protein [Mucilaginibacter sp. Bleaf8]MBS7564677.1 hypothetical protein [Mucilaginibacter sp. Bleaf8]